MMLTAAAMLSAGALSFGTAQATPAAPAGIATAAQTTTNGAIQHVGWGYHRWHRWGWHRPYWRPYHRDWRWRRRGW
jgi:hypothetical protein